MICRRRNKLGKWGVLTSRFRGEEYRFCQRRGLDDVKLVKKMSNASSFAIIGQVQVEISSFASDDDDDGDDGDDDDGSDDSSTGRYGVPEAVRGLAKGISKVAQSQADQVQAQVATQEQVNTLRRQVNTLEHQQRAKNGGGFFGGLFSDA